MTRDRIIRQAVAGHGRQITPTAIGMGKAMDRLLATVLKRQHMCVLGPRVREIIGVYPLEQTAADHGLPGQAQHPD